MKKVINGKLYNTETADTVHSWDNGCYGGDFQRCEETLYRTKKGNYFLYGDGGPMSRYARNCGNNTTSGGEDIQPMTVQEAIEWLEDHDGAEVLTAQFADHIEEA